MKAVLAQECPADGVSGVCPQRPGSVRRYAGSCQLSGDRSSAPRGDFGQQLDKGGKNALVQNFLRLLFQARQPFGGIGRTAEQATVRLMYRPLDYCDNLR
jgi:hypothetical protein